MEPMKKPSAIPDAKQPIPRRRFVGGAAVFTTALALGALTSCSPKASPTAPQSSNTTGNTTGTTGGTPSGGNTPSTLTVTLSSFPALASVGGVAAVGDLGTTPVALTRTGASSFVALSRICTHQGCTVDVTGGAFTCPCHGSQYDNTGSVTNGPATQSLPNLSAVVSGDGLTVVVS